MHLHVIFPQRSCLVLGGGGGGGIGPLIVSVSRIGVKSGHPITRHEDTKGRQTYSCIQCHIDARWVWVVNRASMARAETFSCPTGVRLLNCPARSEALYRLSYPANVDAISASLCVRLLVLIDSRKFIMCQTVLQSHNVHTKFRTYFAAALKVGPRTTCFH